MKTRFVTLVAVAVSMSGCMVGVRPYGSYGPVVAVAPYPPPVVVPVPAPGPVITYAPGSYVWDGYEYVGLYGDRYVYWNSGAWVVCDPVMVGRFHGWAAYHPEWRSHGTPYHHGRDPHR